MDKRIRQAYNDAILAEAMERYGIARDSIHLLDGFESFMYEYGKTVQTMSSEYRTAYTGPRI